MSSAAHIVISDSIRSFTPYDAEFVDELKRQIPSRHRRWDADEHCWRISLTFETTVIRLCNWAFDDVQVTRLQREQRRTPNSQTRAVSSDHATLHLLPTAPRPVIDAAYRAMARMYHPDASNAPDATKRMQQVNAAYERLRQAS